MSRRFTSCHSQANLAVKQGNFLSPLSSSSPRLKPNVDQFPTVVSSSPKRSPLLSPRVKTPTLSSQRRALSTKERYGPTPTRPVETPPTISVERHSLKRSSSAKRPTIPKKAKVKVFTESPMMSGTQNIRRIHSSNISNGDLTQSNNSSSFYSLNENHSESTNICSQADLFVESSIFEASPASTVVMSAKSISRRRDRSLDINSGAKRNSDNRKAVQFGPRLSPEQFDSRLPPSTPIRRGELPPPISSRRIGTSIVKRRDSTLETASSLIHEGDSSINVMKGKPQTSNQTVGLNYII